MENSLIFDFELQFPWALLLLIPLFASIFFYLLKREPTISFPKNLVPAAKISRRFRIKIFAAVPALFYLLSGIAAIFALAGPRFSAGEIVQKSEGIDIILAIDLSGSMAAFEPDKRLRSENEIKNAHSKGETKQRIDICKSEIKKFIKARPDDRIGLIAFSDLPFAVCPPTLDHSWLLKQLDALSLHTIGDGTGLASPIIAAVDRTKNSDTERKVMVLFTDGKNTAENKVSPEQAAEIAKKFSLVVHTVGIGSSRAYFEESGFFGKILVPFREHFDEELLKKISGTTGGKYYAAEDADSMKAALEEIDKIEKKPEEMPRISLYDERASDFAFLAAIFLFVGFCLSRSVFLRFP